MPVAARGRSSTPDPGKMPVTGEWTEHDDSWVGVACGGDDGLVRSPGWARGRTTAGEHREDREPGAGRLAADRCDEALDLLPDERQGAPDVVVATLDDDGLRMGTRQVQPGGQAD